MNSYCRHRVLWSSCRSINRSFKVNQKCCQIPAYCRITRAKRCARTFASSGGGGGSSIVNNDTKLEVIEVRASHQQRHRETVYTVDPINTNQWKKEEEYLPQHLKGSPATTRTTSSTPTTNTDDVADDAWTIRLQRKFYDTVLSHFLPAQFPQSVSPGYAKYSMLVFAASVAGSSSMVLSTQTLLLAVGIVGSSQASTAPVMAGALNWVLKDGIGQLGGVIFASRMGETKRFDSSPKKWRMTAALALDTASVMEILSPLASWAVLPVASAANILKNIGFLTASASRAAIHQSMALSGNLADLTAKAGSQSMAAGLFGTSVGIGLSPLLGHDPNNFIVCFFALSLIHQGCNYASLKYVSLKHFNRHRLLLLIDHYISSSQALSPDEIAKQEVYFPLVNEDKSSSWLSIGGQLQTICPGGPDELKRLLDAGSAEESYVINITDDGEIIQLVFLCEATGEDLILGIFHAFLAHKQQQVAGSSHLPPDEMIAESYGEVKKLFPNFLAAIDKKGWKTATELTNVEPSGAFRLAINR